jgi:hypothetical protein
MKHHIQSVNILIVAMSIFTCGCYGERTEQLIDYIDPEGMVVIPKEEGDKATRSLNKDEYIILNNGNYLIHKSKMKTIQGYTIIVAAAPVTITIDSAMYVVQGVAKLLTIPDMGSIPSRFSK